MKKLLLLVLVLTSLTSQAQKIHLFFLADPLDKHNPKDRRELENYWRYIGPYLDYPVAVSTSSNKDELMGAIKKADIKPNADIVVFYFSGRGEAASDRAWPIMHLRNNGDDVPQRDVIAALRPKRAHLTLVIADCDNLPEPVLIARMIPRPHPPILREKCQQLYLGKTEGKRLFINMAAASVGQRALRDKNGNSLFLSALLATLNEKTSEGEPKWGATPGPATVKATLTKKLLALSGGKQTLRCDIVRQAAPDGDDETDDETPTPDEH